MSVARSSATRFCAANCNLIQLLLRLVNTLSDLAGHLETRQTEVTALTALISPEDVCKVFTDVETTMITFKKTVKTAEKRIREHDKDAVPPPTSK